jgi:hypothetical protein
MIFFIFFIFCFFDFFLRPRFIITHHINQRISRKTLLKSNFIPHKPYASVHVKYRSNKWGLSNPTHESKIGISNDRQCSKTLNIPMTCIPQLRCKLCPIKNIAINKKKKFYIQAKTNIYKQKQTKRQTECLSTSPNLNDTLSPMWQEIHYSGMRYRDMPRPRHPPNLNIKTPVKD